MAKKQAVKLEFGKENYFYETPDDQELYELGDEADFKAMRSTTLPPHESAKGTASFTVTDQNGRPVSGVRVKFKVSAIHPTGAWRTESGMAGKYPKRQQAKARRLIQRGAIRLLGTLNRTSATTNSQGTASVEYTASHIASTLSQNKKGHERITATLDNGTTKTMNVYIGHTGLVVGPTIPKGIRFIGAKGKYMQKELKSFLTQLGNGVKKNWPHPVTITAASLKWGGQYPIHFTHKHGATLDLRPMSTDGKPTWAKTDGTHKANYDAERTKALISILKDAGGKVTFNGKGAGGKPLAGHDDHIHVSWLAKTSLHSAKKLKIEPYL